MTRNFNLEIGFHEALKKRLEELRMAKLVTMASGPIKDTNFEAFYRSAVAYLRALDEFAAEAEDLRKKLTEM